MTPLDPHKDRIGIPAEQVVRATLSLHPRLLVPGMRLECNMCDRQLVTAHELNGGIACRTCGYLISADERDDLIDRMVECLEHLRTKTKEAPQAQVEEKRTKFKWQSLMFWRKRK